MTTPSKYDSGGNRQDQTGKVVDIHGARVEVDGIQDDHYELGEWFWVYVDQHGQEEKVARLMCLTKMGSNYYGLEEPANRETGTYRGRVLHSNAHEEMVHEPEADRVIREYLGMHESRVQALMNQVQELTARLGVTPANTLGHSSEGVAKVNKALSVLSDQTDIKAYEHALVKAKKEDLPALFEEIKKEQAEVARWMSANMLPLQAQSGQLKDSLSEIDNRIFNVSLYAGLNEHIVQVADGEPAPMGTRLHVMQRRLYMDEECLLNYKTGGMEFNDIREFDRWLVEPENLNRILPFQRCIVAMRVRRTEKEREADGTLQTALINFRLKEADKKTFLYIRNGEKVYCLESDQNFGELIFPDKATFDPSEPVMVKMFADRVDQIITVREYEDRVKETREWDAKAERWREENPYEQWREEKRQALLQEWDRFTEEYKQDQDSQAQWLERQLDRHADRHRYSWSNPYREDSLPCRIRASEWKRFDRDNVYYDEIANTIRAKILEYNRIALIIQGLFDRSETLHPHGPVRTWEPQNFQENIELVYDGSALLNYGEAPDIDAYIARCNESLREGSVTVGQEAAWLEKEAEREQARRDRSWRERSDIRVGKWFRPLGNDGPGYVARVQTWKPRAKQAVFSWHRERLTDTGYPGERWGDPIRTTITVDENRLFNCDAYQPGDYKKFFQDPRTRAQYLKWAPMLLAAEEYKAGNIKPQEPVRKD